MCFLFTNDADLCTKTKMSALKIVINIAQYINQSYSYAHCKETGYDTKILIRLAHVHSLPLPPLAYQVHYTIYWEKTKIKHTIKWGVRGTAPPPPPQKKKKKRTMKPVQIFTLKSKGNSKTNTNAKKKKKSQKLTQICWEQQQCLHGSLLKKDKVYCYGRT